jgi:fructokinase
MASMTTCFTAVGLGEILWDLLPGGKQLGGAPSNFAYMANLLGDEGVVASRVGEDALGREVVETLTRLGLETTYLQFDGSHPTGTVDVRVDSNGQPEFTITEGVAWDYLEWRLDWADLAKRADVVCFGSLAQRSDTSRATILQFLRSLSPKCLRVFDVNLRQSFYSAEVIRQSLGCADIMKVNHTELPKVAELLGVNFHGEAETARAILQSQSLKLICITRGDSGSLLVGYSENSEHSGFRVRVEDTVGAGDAFTACMAHCYLRGEGLEAMNESANRFAAWVASHPGATPSLDGRTLNEVLSAIGE